MYEMADPLSRHLTVSDLALNSFLSAAEASPVHLV
jgi:hypothetical protein